MKLLSFFPTSAFLLILIIWNVVNLGLYSGSFAFRYTLDLILMIRPQSHLIHLSFMPFFISILISHPTRLFLVFQIISEWPFFPFAYAAISLIFCLITPTLPHSLR